MLDDTINVPAEAIEYIEKRSVGAGAFLYKFEIIELFFEWFSMLTREKQLLILKKLICGAVDSPSIYNNE